VIINRYEGSRRDLRGLFEIAEDSAAQLNVYIDDGDVLVAQNAGEIVGHLQLIPYDPISGEIKNLAVLPGVRRRGVGGALVRQAIDIAHHNGWNELVVRTATADTGNLRFYQRLGFRCVAIEPDVYTAASGYPANLMIDGIPLRDAIVLSQSLRKMGIELPSPIMKSALQVRVARQSADLDTVVAFCRDGLGLPEIGRFAGHAGYDGVLLDLPGTRAHLEFTATSHLSPPAPHPEDLLVLFFGSREAVDQALGRLDVQPVRSANPYWDRIGVTVPDPDGFRVAEAWTA